MAKNAPKDGAADDEDEMDMDETDYHPVAADAAGPVRRKEKKGMDFSRWCELAMLPPNGGKGSQCRPRNRAIRELMLGLWFLR